MDAFELAILRNLFYHGYIGGRHTAIENLYRGFPSHLRGDAEKAAERLLKHGWLVRKTTGYGLQVSINPLMLPALKKELEVERAAGG